MPENEQPISHQNIPDPMQGDATAPPAETSAAPPKAKPPTRDELRFLDEYVACGENGTDAWRLTHPKCNAVSARTLAARLLAKVGIAEHLDAARQAYRARNRPRYMRILEEWTKIAHADIGTIIDFTKNPPQLRPGRDIPPSARQAIQSITITPIPAPPPKKGKRRGKPLVKIEVKMIDKRGALDKISLHLGVYEPMSSLEKILSGLPEHMADGIRAEVQRHAALRAAGGQAGVPPRVGTVVEPDQDPQRGRDVRGPQQDPGAVASKIPRELFDSVDGARLSSGAEIDVGSGEGPEPLFD